MVRDIVVNTLFSQNKSQILSRITGPSNSTLNLAARNFIDSSIVYLNHKYDIKETGYICYPDDKLQSTDLINAGISEFYPQAMHDQFCKK